MNDEAESGVWKCAWCQKMIAKFTITGQNEDGTVFEGYDKHTGRRWKLRGTESWTEGAWRSTDEASVRYRY